MEKTLGLDLGTNSIGWAIIERDEQVKLLDKGVHIFQEGVKIEKGIESSKAAERTDHRALRRHYFRRRLRKIEVLTVLSEFGLCPPLTIEELRLWKEKGIYPLNDEFVTWQRTDDTKDKNPYRCRFDAVNRELNLNVVEDRYTLGRAFYHIAQRRGFLSNRLETTKESDGDVKKSINGLNIKITETGCRTLGEFFYRCYGNEKIRNNYTSRLEHYKAEFDEICTFQALSSELKKSIERAIFYQRPLKSQKGLVGKCTFEKDKARCPISHPRFEYYRMLCFVNNIRIKSVYDTDWRPLTSDEKKSIEFLFLRKSKETFDFEDIAKHIAGKGNYAYRDNPQGKPYLFNFKLNTTVSGSSLTAQLSSIFGENWQDELFNRYTLRNNKAVHEVVNDIWHAIFSFDKEECLEKFAKERLMLDDEKAQKFAKIKTHRDYAALSLNAINKILPFLEQGMIYSHSVFLANMGSILPANIWNNETDRKSIIAAVISEVDNYDIGCGKTMQQNIIGFLRDNFELKSCAEQKLYHPSMIETYPASKDELLGSPRTNAVRNPMAMRTLFQLRRLINQLLKEEKITPETKINIELSRQLNNANMRKAIEERQRKLANENSGCQNEILKLTGIDPTDDEVLKYRLWIEQDKVCLYTGKQISIEDFIGANPMFDIEHTIPRSIGGDNSQMNKTLADCRYNRDVKGAKLPSELVCFDAIKVRVESWKDRIEELEKKIEDNKKRKTFSTKEDKDKHITRRNVLILELRYWTGKYNRLTAKEVKQEFRNSQGVDAGIISKYARLYLKSLFPKIYSIKGEMTAEFRKLWGIQQEYQKKDRSNHIHHCIDAITIACIGKYEYDRMSHYYGEHERFEQGRGGRPAFSKPWGTFAQDVKAIEEELLISHYTADNLGKNSRKKKRIRGKIVKDEFLQGDTARGSLHQETYYGAILREGEEKYVVRKELKQLKEGDVDKIVDEVVRGKVQQAVKELGFKEAMASVIWMNEEKKIPIKKVRCFTPSVTNPLHIRTHRDQSIHKHKQTYHVVNDGNYLMAIYEGFDAKGKLKRNFEILNNLTAASMLKHSADKLSFPDIIPISKGELPLKAVVKTGTMVIFYENNPNEIWELDKRELKKRLYKVTGMSSMIIQGKYEYGTLTFKHHQEARPSGELKTKNGVFKTNEEYRAMISIYHTQFNALVQGYDFDISVLGEIKQKERC